MKIAKVALTIAIAIVFAVFVGYGLYTVYEPPTNRYSTNDCYTKNNCDKYLSECSGMGVEGKYDPSKSQQCYNKVYASQEYQSCQKSYEQCNIDAKKQSESYSYFRNSFYILILIGLLAIIGCIVWSRFDSIVSGFIGGGVLVVLWSLIYTADYWLTLNKFVRLVALGVVLAVLIYLGYKKIEAKIEKKS